MKTAEKSLFPKAMTASEEAKYRKVMAALPEAAREAILSDPDIATVRVYPDGWVPNSYRWAAPGRLLRFFRGSDGFWTVEEGVVDRKRSGGKGPEWVAFSANGGRLASS